MNATTSEGTRTQATRLNHVGGAVSAVARRGVVVGVVGPDGSGKSAFADALRSHLTEAGHAVFHTHGRPQAIGHRRRAPQRLNVEAPQSAPPRGSILSLVKYLLAMLDFAVARRRILRDADVWISERPLLDYEVDPARHQLAHRVLPAVRALNRIATGPDVLVLLTGDPGQMVERKPEIAPAEVERQLRVWEAIARRTPVRAIRPDSTSGATPSELALRVATHELALPGVDWRTAPVKPFRLDVRLAGRDTAALDVYRPIRWRAVTAERLGRTLARLGWTRGTACPTPLATALAYELPGTTGVAALRSSYPDRWVVGVAQRRRLTYVAKVGAGHDEGLQREATNLEALRPRPVEGVVVPHVERFAHDRDGTLLLTRPVAERLRSVTEVETAVAVAEALARAGWTHGDLAPWNLFHTDAGAVALVDWEEARQALEPLADIVHFLLRLGATTDRRRGRNALRQLLEADSRFARLFEASAIPADRGRVRSLIVDYLDATEARPVSPREAALRRWVRREVRT